MTKLTIVKCDRCGREMMNMDEVFIEHGKERRKPYRGSKAIDPSCRNHGGCPWCERNRKHKFRDKYAEEPNNSPLDFEGEKG